MNFQRQLRQLKKILPGEIFLQPATLEKYAGDKWFASTSPTPSLCPARPNRFPKFYGSQTNIKFPSRRAVPGTAMLVAA